MFGSRPPQFYTTKNPRDDLLFGLTPVFLSIFSMFYFGENLKSALLLGLCVYVMCMMKDHRKIFVLRNEPSYIMLVNGNLHGDFWKNVERSGISIKQMEGFFWIEFWYWLVSIGACVSTFVGKHGVTW